MSTSDYISLDEWNEPLPPEERERLLQSVADAVARRGLQTPAIFALEIHRPLAFMASQGMIALTPLLGPLLGRERMQQVGRFLTEPDAIDMLIARIENGPLTPNNGGTGKGQSRASGSPIIGGGGGTN